MYLYREQYPLIDGYSDTRIVDTARFIVAFKMRHPIAYALWYCWRLRLALTREERAGLSVQIKFHEENGYSFGSQIPRGVSRLDEFALWHPALFLFVDLFQFLKKAIVCPGKVSCS